MNEIKLQLGKTYRNRKGEEVKVVGKTNASWHLYQGSNGRWYTEAGQWCNSESPHDLIEEVKEVPETRHTFAIPDGVKELTVEQVGNRIVVEMVPEKGPKPGDVCINDVGSVYIFKEAESEEVHRHYAWLGRDASTGLNSSTISGRPATPEEAQPLWDALKKAGKRWNPETMQVEAVAERERIMDFLRSYLNNVTWSHEQLCKLVESYLKHKDD